MLTVEDGLMSLTSIVYCYKDVGGLPNGSGDYFFQIPECEENKNNYTLGCTDSSTSGAVYNEPYPYQSN
jgi:hypothetical protein